MKVNTIVLRVDTVYVDTSFEDLPTAALSIQDVINRRIEELESLDGVDVTSVTVISRETDQQIGIISYRQLVKVDA